MFAQIVIPTVPAWILSVGTLATPFLIAWNNRRNQSRDVQTTEMRQERADHARRISTLEQGFAGLTAEVRAGNRILEMIHNDLRK
jgi:hypothetical protein